MVLTDKKIQAAKGTEKPQAVRDGGLYLLVNPNGSKWWRFKYRVNGKEKAISLGVYPDVSLAKARARRDEARALVADQKDPSAQRQSDKASKAVTFEAVAREWLGLQEKNLVAITLAKALSTCQKPLNQVLESAT